MLFATGAGCTMDPTRRASQTPSRLGREHPSLSPLLLDVSIILSVFGASFLGCLAILIIKSAYIFLCHNSHTASRGSVQQPAYQLPGIYHSRSIFQKCKNPRSKAPFLTTRKVTWG